MHRGGDAADRVVPVSRLRDSVLLKRTVIVCVVFLSLLRIAGYRDLLTSVVAVRNDFTPDYTSAAALRHGADPYEQLRRLYPRYLGRDAPLIFHLDPEQRNAHPPAMIVFAIPFTAVPLRTARAVWFFMSLLATFFAVFLFSRRLHARPATSAVIALAALALPVVESDLRWAQFDGLLLFAMVLAWADLVDGRDRRAGAVLGLIAALKVFPWLLIVPLIRNRRIRAVRSFLVVAGVATAVGVIAVGIPAAKEYLTVAIPRDVRFWSTVSMGSLYASPHQWSTAAGLEVRGVVAVFVRSMTWLFFGAGVLVAFLTRGQTTGSIFWATAPLMILIAPIAWPFYFVTLIPLALLLMRPGQAGAATRRRVLAGIAAAVLLCGLPLIDRLQTTIGLWNRLIPLAALITLALCDVVRYAPTADPEGSRSRPPLAYP